jgi:hypothetical protein
MQAFCHTQRPTFLSFYGICEKGSALPFRAVQGTDGQGAAEGGLYSVYGRGL